MTVPFVLDRTVSGPLHLQIAMRLRTAITAGVLTPGVRLPSARSLAGQLGVARGTVDAGYAVLIAEGVVVPRGSAGTIVSPDLAARVAPPAQRRMPFAPPRAEPPPAPLPFRMGLPALDAFPRKLWTSLIARAARGLGAEALALPDPSGWRPLREAIATYLGVSRGILCGPDQVLVTAGFQGALALVAKLLLRTGDPVWVEDPGYLLARHALEAAGATLVPVRVDRDGLRVAAGMVAAPRARLAVVTPAHQSPLGVALSLPRRLALLGWAADAGAWVLEDDYDSEFRYTGHPLPALKSLDRGGRVLYAGSFSEVLFPALRLGYLVVPDELAEAFARASRLGSCGLPSLEQRVVATFMAEGHFARHLRRMRTLYAARRSVLAAALAAAFGDRMVLQLEAGGMHLLARFPGAADDGTLARRAAAAGLAPTALSSLVAAHDCGQGLLLGFANVPEAEAEARVRLLAGAVGLGAAREATVLAK
ncbi:MAG TPA: PLP-dependent aminotransferase family protein [Acetobacteraceae bacterium]|nr:PLP-dependent aminotransferase family protein [Acetobacteraceae bacterium]